MPYLLKILTTLSRHYLIFTLGYALVIIKANPAYFLEVLRLLPVLEISFYLI